MDGSKDRKVQIGGGLPDCVSAEALLLEKVKALGPERVPLEECCGRVLAEEIRAAAHVPAFDRSPYDGYALRAADVKDAAADAPVTLRIIEEIPAGKVPVLELTPGTAAKILTGAMLPAGADAVEMFERTAFTAETVTFTRPVQPGSNLICRGEDLRQGQLLAARGVTADPGLLGVLASQGITEISVYRKPVVGIISTGTEVVEPEAAGEAGGTGAEQEPRDPSAPTVCICPPMGKIFNSNRYLFEGELRRSGCIPRWFGIARDRREEIRALLKEALAVCDAVILTGGVSVGDYDLTGLAIADAGAEILFNGVAMKPGKACTYGMLDGKLIAALSGNPASALTNYYAVARAGLNRLMGKRAEDCGRKEIRLILKEAFPKASKTERYLRGILDLSDGTVRIRFDQGQKNSVLRSTVGCDVMAVIPAGSGPLPAGAEVRGILI